MCFSYIIIADKTLKKIANVLLFPAKEMPDNLKKINKKKSGKKCGVNSEVN